MNSFFLLCALRDFLTPELARLPLAAKSRPMRGDSPPAKTNESRPAQIYIGDVQPKSLKPTAVASGSEPLSDQAASMRLRRETSDAARERTKDELVPFICLQERGGHDVDGMTRTEIVIRCAVYSPEPEQAAHELANLVTYLRHALMQKRLLENKYRLLTDHEGRLLPWETPTEQNHPYAESWILSVWECKSIEGA